MFGMRIECARLLIDRLDPHLAYKPPNTVSTNEVALSAQMPHHLAATVIRRGQKLLVDQAHEL